MNRITNACIAYIAFRLLTGKRIAKLYDIAASEEIDITTHVDADFIREFDEKHMNYIAGYASDSSYSYTSVTGYSLEIVINGKTFIIHLRGSSAYFIGNIQKDTIYLYDHKGASHFRFRVTDYADEKERAL